MTRDRSPFRQARICECGEMGFVGLTKGKVAFFDVSDLPAIQPWRWHLHGPYAGHFGRGPDRRKAISMHVALAGRGQDHINRDPLDNRRGNLRPASQAENMRNRGTWGRTGFKGVFPSGRRFRAAITVRYKQHVLGSFPCPIEAARAYDQAAVELHGEFAATNASLGLLPSEAA